MYSKVSLLLVAREPLCYWSNYLVHVFMGQAQERGGGRETDKGNSRTKGKRSMAYISSSSVFQKFTWNFPKWCILGGFSAHLGCAMSECMPLCQTPLRYSQSSSSWVPKSREKHKIRCQSELRWGQKPSNSPISQTKVSRRISKKNSESRRVTLLVDKAKEYMIF